jgi:hypothetical protein
MIKNGDRMPEISQVPVHVPERAMKIELDTLLSLIISLPSEELRRLRDTGGWLHVENT